MNQRVANEHRMKMEDRRQEQRLREPSVAKTLSPEFHVWRNKQPKYKRNQQVADKKEEQ